MDFASHFFVGELGTLCVGPEKLPVTACGSAWATTFLERGKS